VYSLSIFYNYSKENTDEDSGLQKKNKNKNVNKDNVKTKSKKFDFESMVEELGVVTVSVTPVVSFFLYSNFIN
jgi:hypothetical protein